MLGRKDVDEIQDLMQQTFFAAWQHIGELRNHHRFAPWLRRIARNLAIDHLRRRRRRAAGLKEWIKELRRRKKDCPPTDFWELIQILPDPIDREILYLRFVQELTYPEIAQEVGIDIDADAIRKRVAKMELVLREELE
jgi:RNA polymerase sigma-70 factor (ECF subfamily)